MAAFRLCVLIFGLVCVSRSAKSQARSEIRGAVTDTAGAPIGGVEVVVLPAVGRAVADSNGRFQLSGVPSGVVTLVARRVGFAPETTRVTIARTDVPFVRFSLRRTPAVLSEVNVRDSARMPARFDDFERRRARRMGGQYLSQLDIERRHPRVTSDLLRGLLGVRIVDSMGVTLAISSRGPKTSLIGGKAVPVPCVMRVGVDGSIKEPYFPINSILPSDIYGVEIQHSANMPPEFGGAGQNAFCGLVMIWTR